MSCKFIKISYASYVYTRIRSSHTSLSLHHTLSNAFFSLQSLMFSQYFLIFFFNPFRSHSLLLQSLFEGQDSQMKGFRCFWSESYSQRVEKTINAATSPKVEDIRGKSERRVEAFCTVSSTLLVSDSRLVWLTKSESIHQYQGTRSTMCTSVVYSWILSV